MSMEKSMEIPEINHTLTLQDMVFQIWKRRYLVAILTLLGGVMGVVVALTTKPVYEATALLQLDIKADNQAAPTDFTQMQKYLSSEISSEGETGLLRSRSVLGEVVDRMNLDLMVGTEGAFVKRLLRRPVPELNLEVLRVPEVLLEKAFDLVVTDSAGNYELRDSLGTVILKGRVGELVDSAQNSLGITILVLNITNAEIGQVFKLMKAGSQEAIENLGKRFSASEEGRKTGMMALSLLGNDPRKTARTLDTLMAAYQAVGARLNAAAAEKRAKYLEAQLPSLKAAMDSADNALHRYRKQNGSLDIQSETQLALESYVRLQQQAEEMEKRRKEASEKFRPDHPAIATMDSSLFLIKAQIRRQDASMRGMPSRQQEVLRLEREAITAEEMYTSVMKESHNYRVVAEQAVPSAKIIDQATPSLRPEKPKKKNLVLGAIVGAFLFGCILSVAMRILLGGIESPELMETIIGRPVLTILPRVKEQKEMEARIADGRKGTHILAHATPDHIALECLRALRVPLMNAVDRAENKVVTVTGASPDDGKSFVSANLAVLLAQSRLRVALIDADFRRGHLHKAFGLSRGRGLANVLAGEMSVAEAMVAVDLPGLSFLATGATNGRPFDLLSSPKMASVLQELSDLYDVVLVDVAPLLAVSDADVLGQMAGTSLLVLRHGMHATGDLIACRKRIIQADLKVLGTVVNDVDLMAPIYGTRFGRRLHQYRSRTA